MIQNYIKFHKKPYTMRHTLFPLAGTMLLMGTVLLCGCHGNQQAQPVLNEICGKDADGLEWIEVGNPTQTAINLRNYKLTKMDAEGIDKTLYKFPDTLLQPGAIITVNEEDLRYHVPNKKAAIIELLDPEGNTVDSFDSQEELDLSGHAQGASYARIPNLTGDWALCPHATWDAPNPKEE